MIESSIPLGCRLLEVSDPVQSARIPVRVLYPTTAVPETVAFGPYALEVALDAPVLADRGPLPMVAFSHGNGATSLTMRELAMSVARAGFAVALVDHPGNMRGDNALADSPANLANRPRHIRLALDALLADSQLGPHLAPDRAAVVGLSFGGYTALATAGGQPMALPSQTPDGIAHAVAIEADPRVDTIVLLVPALPWFMATGALAGVRARIFVRTAELDPLAPPPFVEQILRGLPSDTLVDSQVVPRAGHFSFLSPFPPALASPSFAPSIDPPGFDRVAYQPQLARDVIAFLDPMRPVSAGMR